MRAQRVPGPGLGKLTCPPTESALATHHLRKSIKTRTMAGAIASAGGQGGQLILAVAYNAILARLISPHDFGLVAMAMVVAGFLQVFKDAGLSTATIQRADITYAQVSNLFWVNVAVGGTAMLGMAATAPLVAWFFHQPELVGISVALSIGFLLEALVVQHIAILNRQMRFTLLSGVRLCRRWVSYRSHYGSHRLGVLVAGLRNVVDGRVTGYDGVESLAMAAPEAGAWQWHGTARAIRRGLDACWCRVCGLAGMRQPAHWPLPRQRRRWTLLAGNGTGDASARALNRTHLCCDCSGAVATSDRTGTVPKCVCSGIRRADDRGISSGWIVISVVECAGQGGPGR